MNNRPIGIFDSGLGGLTVVKELMAQIPNESIVYFGDTARIPYGTRSKETVIKYSIQCIRFLLSKNIKTVVIACNTASSIALNALKGIFDIPIIGVIEPGAAAAVRATCNNKIGIIGTEATIQSKAYSSIITEKKPDIETYEVACSLFVPIVEEGWSDTQVACLTAQRYLGTMKMQQVDTVILGCTHYPLLTNTISKVMGPKVTLVDPAVDTARELRRLLEENDMFRETSIKPQYSYYLSDFGQKFRQIGSRFLGRDIQYVSKVDIEKY
jgi:glutamate racemase